MALVRWDATRELDTLQGEVNRLFSNFFDTPAGAGINGSGRRWLPAMDLVQTKDDFVLRADLPGIGDGDVSIEVENNVLTIAGERKADHDERHEGYYRIERATGAFSRSLSLPDGIDPASLSASFDSGVLTVRIPKPAQTHPQRVKIAVGSAREHVVEREDAVEADAA